MNTLMKRFFSIATLSAVLVSSMGLMTATAEVPSVSYIIYDCDTNTTTNNPYSLTLSENTGIQSRKEIGADNRYRSGYSGIVRLVFDHDNNGTVDDWNGTGFIVGDHQIATAAHCVYDIKNAKYASNLQIQMYNDDGEPTSVLYDVEEIHIPSTFVNGNVVSNDYALLTVANDLSEYNQFELGVACDAETLDFMANVILNVSGIPQGAAGVNNNTIANVYTGSGGTNVAHPSTETVLHYTCDTSSGMSGSPVYTAIDYTIGSDSYIVYTAVAIHYGGGSYANGGYRTNKGARVNGNIIQFYLNNPYIGY